MRHLYTAVFYLALPIVFLKLWNKGKNLPAYKKRWGERLGRTKYPSIDAQPVWIHTVSVGEFIAARSVISHLLKNSNQKVVVTTMTPSGSEQVLKTFGDKVFHCYIPYDLPILLKKFFHAINPSCLIIMETELWPNVIHECHKRNIPSIIINARLSEKSKQGYKKFPKLTKTMLQQVTHIAAQNIEDGERFKELGLPEHSLTVTGNIKFDFDLSDDLLARAFALKAQYSKNGSRHVIIAGSTHPGEDEIILEAFSLIKKRYPRCLLVLAPRHTERAAAIEELCHQLTFSTLLRSSKITPLIDTDVVLGDTMGELVLLYGTADAAIVCGSFVSVGGHNYIEPASLAVPILSGPHTFNFSKVVALLQEKNALCIVENASTLANASIHLLDNEALRKDKGTAAKQVADENKGALLRLLNLLDNYL